MEEEKHVCYYCGQEAHYQFKNGKWCCSVKLSYCPQYKRKIRQKTLQGWKLLKEKGIKNRKDIPIQDRKNVMLDEPEGVCCYCGSHADYKLKNGRWCCKPHSTQCPQNRRKNSNGVLKAYQNGLQANKVFSQQSRFRQGSGRRGKNKFNSEQIREWGKRLSYKYKNGQIKHHQLDKNHTEEQIQKIIGGMYSTSRKDSTKKYGYKKGWYKGYWCDSSWELAFVIYNLEHGIKFERNLQKFQYWFNGKKLHFYPDFKMEDGSLVQIKGWFGQKNQAKIASFPNIVLITKTEIQKYLEYVILKYGKDFYRLYEKSKENIK